MRRYALLAICTALCLALAAALAGCGPSGAPSSERPDGASDSGGSSTNAGPSAQKLADEIQGEAGSADWGAGVSTVSVVDKFRQPVIVVRVDGDETLRDSTSDAIVALLDELSPQGPWYLEVYPGQSELYVASSRGTSRVGPAPAPAPSRPEDIKAWIDETYGTGSSDPVDEAWYAAIQSMTYDPASKTVVVKTSIEGASPEGQTLAFLIVLAVDEPMLASPQHEWVKVLYADGNEYLARSEVENPYVK